MIVSNDRANAGGRVGSTEVSSPWSPSRATRSACSQFQTLLPAAGTGLKVDSKAQAEQIRSVAVERIGPVLGTVPARIMGTLDDALRLHLGL